MKKILMFLIMAIALLSSAFAVSVSDDSIAAEDAVERSNPRLEGDNAELDDSTELEYADFTMTVTANSGDINITKVVPDLSAFTYADLTDENDDSDKYVIVTSLPQAVASGNTKNIQLKILVPSNLDAVDSSLNLVQHSVPVVVTTNVTNVETQTTGNAKFYVESGLELQNVEIRTALETIGCDVEEVDIEDLDCDDEIEEVPSSSDFKLLFEIENIFDSDSDLDLEDVEIDLDVDNSDIDPDDDNFDEDIDTEDEITFTVDMEVDSDVEDGDDVTITITAFAEDDNGAQHGFKHSFTIDFEVPKYDVRVNSAVLSPGQICQGEVARLTWDIENYGSKDQDNVRIQIVNDALGLDEISSRINLEAEDERDNDNKGSFTIQTSPNTKAGSYPVSFRVFYEDDGDDETIVDTLNLRIVDCEGDDVTQTPAQPEQPTQEEQQTPIVIVNPAPSQPTTGQPTSTVTTSSNTAGPVQAVVAKKSSNVWFIIGGIIVLLVLIALIILVISLLLR